MHRKTTILTSPGLVIGGAFCLLAAIVGNRGNGAGDATMAKYEVLGFASAPLSSFLGSTIYRTKEGTMNPVLWNVMDYGQVLVNWILLSVLIGWVITLIAWRVARKNEGY